MDFEVHKTIPCEYTLLILLYSCLSTITLLKGWHTPTFQPNPYPMYAAQRTQQLASTRRKNSPPADLTQHPQATQAWSPAQR
ncbi:hypothetical protein RRG08_028936 [Elysia crispata]|uniref:Uncharacterized protein n=1 Tax=Elysia crispata TaxID=231223 RepID=A0AAE1E3S5_9GAST|nr:hypothetical protein RRG08_028936 [Elysia crispata]